MDTRQTTRIVAAAVVLSLVGCVDPGRLARDDLIRYQEELVRRTSIEPEGSGLGLLRGDPAVPGAPLDVIRDTETGKTVINLSLKEAVTRALANNLDIRVVGLDPELSRQDMILAASVFDFVTFAGASYSKTDQRTNSVFSSKTVRGDVRTIEAGVRKRTVTGAEVSMTYTMSRDWTDNVAVRHSTTYPASLTLQVSQPLLRDAWPAVNMAAVHVAQINRRISEQAFRQRVEEVVSQVVTTYWTLDRARRDRNIQEKLLTETLKTLRQIEARRLVDANNVVIAQTQAAVETRRASLIRARKFVWDAQDALARQLNDPVINLQDSYVIMPVTPASTVKVKIDVQNQLQDALQHNALLRQAQLAVKAADVNLLVAENGILPKLDVVGSMTNMGLDDSRSTSNDQVVDSRYNSWTIGMVFEYPLGNRGPEAELAKARIQRLMAITEVRSTAQFVAQDVKEKIRRVETSFDEIQAQRNAVKAAKIQLDALEAASKIRPLTPEFMQVKLSAQETLANTARAELEALVNYNAARIQLAQATGTVLNVYGVELVLQDSPQDDQ